MWHRPSPPPTPKCQRGSSLIEALIALLVLALGVMGMALVQTQTLVESRATNQRAVAVMMAEDLGERMQVNIAGRPGFDAYLTDWGPPAAVAPPSCLSQLCTGAQLAAFDLHQWKTTLGQLLLNGDARVFRSGTDTSQFGVLIGWSATQAKREALAATDAERQQYQSAVAVVTGVDAITCPDGRICHLVYIRP